MEQLVHWQKKSHNTNQNAVEAGLVFRAEVYKNSSAVDYSDEKGLLDYIVVFKMFGF
ncbi:hypothetical protein [Chryseobacterium sp. Leaf394]|uniref:hypothetical protein n=1 Tax=Chryseobacterium sp. Leaf394 TaxID=1736361 RepID=UPI000AED7D32|nr:hypothetical protein [Chryseobacterium sp. Leaf394]